MVFVAATGVFFAPRVGIPWASNPPASQCGWPNPTISECSAQNSTTRDSAQKRSRPPFREMKAQCPPCSGAIRAPEASPQVWRGSPAAAKGAVNSRTPVRYPAFHGSVSRPPRRVNVRSKDPSVTSSQ